MNKEWKTRLLIFIISGIIFTGVGVIAEVKITADKVTYSGDVTVKDKIDDLYTTQENTISAMENTITNLELHVNSLQSQLEVFDSADCITGSFVCGVDGICFSGKEILSYFPSRLVMFSYDAMNGFVAYYDLSQDSTNYIQLSKDDGKASYKISDYLILNNKFNPHGWYQPHFNNKTVYYMACK